MKIYILTIVDLDTVGFYPKDVEVYTKKEDAIASMRKQYLEKCEKEGITDPDAKVEHDHQITDGYAFIFGASYWDIFEKEVREV